MRVLLPVDRLHAAGIGAMTRGLVEHLPAALAAGDELLFTWNGRTLVRPPAVVTGDLPTRGPIGRAVFEQLGVPIATRAVDLLHLADYRPVVVAPLPFLVTIHDVAFLDEPTWFPPKIVRFKRRMLKLALQKGPAMIVCVSEYSRRRLVAHFPDVAEREVRVIHPGVAPAAVRAGDGRDDDPYFLTVSTIEPRKNHLGLLRAFQAARRNGLGLRWKVAGAIGYAGEPIAEALRAADGVDLLGEVIPEVRERLFREARFVASPSHVEGFGFPPLEAMTRGIPTFCSEGSAFDETLGDAALRAPSDDISAWQDGLLRLEQDDDLRSRLVQRGLARSRTFSWPDVAQAYVRVYREIDERQV